MMITHTPYPLCLCHVVCVHSAQSYVVCGVSYVHCPHSTVHSGVWWCVSTVVCACVPCLCVAHSGWQAVEPCSVVPIQGVCCRCPTWWGYWQAAYSASSSESVSVV